MSLKTKEKHLDVQVPVAATPKVTPNEDEKDIKRRASFYSRGKRASSMKKGKIGYPHPTIDPKKYWQHISPENPDPVRMKQLMSWLFRRGINGQQSEHAIALSVAKAAEEEVLKSLVDGSLNLSWYSQPIESNKGTSISNPINIENDLKLIDVRDDIIRLREAQAKWAATIKEINIENREISSQRNTTKPRDLGEPWLSKLRELQNFDFPLIGSETIDAIKKLEKNVDLLSQTLTHVHRQQSNINEDCAKVSSAINISSRDPLLSTIDPIYLARGLAHQLPPYGPQ